MSLSLIGIIFVQAYYINNILKTKEEQDIVIITLLSLVFTLIIIIGYMSAVYQLIRQAMKRVLPYQWAIRLPYC